MTKTSYGDLPSYKLVTLESDQKKTKKGWLVDPAGTTHIPVVNDSIYFNEADLLFGEVNADQVEATFEKVNQKRADYERFARRKSRRASGEIYAGFQPFNESCKSFYPFIAGLKKRLKPGDVIVNLWDRGGWFTAMLLGLFPEQKIFTTWEGDKNVLGYSGYDFWFAQHQNPDRLQVVFCDHNKPFPFEDSSAALVFAYDAFHWFDQSLWMREIMRICKPDGSIIFPHNHLSNNEPEPWFDRGGKQMHGKQYQAFFDRQENNTGRKGYIFPEPEMFWLNDMTPNEPKALDSQPETEHYNALLAMLPADWDEPLKGFRFTDLEKPEDCFVILNGLLTIDLNRQNIKLDGNKHNGMVRYLLDRHPVYEQRILDDFQGSLSEVQTRMLFLATQMYTVKEISEKLALPLQDTIEQLLDFQSRDIVQVVPLNANGASLQHFLSAQEYVVPRKEQTLANLWDWAQANFADQLAIVSEADESEFTYADCADIVDLICQGLEQQGLSKGDYVLIQSAIHAEAVLTIWACMRLGIIAVPLNTNAPTKMVDHVLAEIEIKIAFTDIANFEKIDSGIPVFVFDDEESEMSFPWFSDWLEEVDEEKPVVWPTIEREDKATILYTSGSSGIPKGVMHTHGHLFRSARLITETFEWESDDRFFAFNDLDSMSGLRNTCLAVLEVGACLIIPDPKHKGNVLAYAESIGEHQATVIAANPPFFRQLTQFQERCKDQVSSLRLAMCTGSALHDQLKETFKSVFGLHIYNYYGLTETTGICISESPRFTCSEPDSIGWPVGSIIQMVDDEGKLVEEGQAGNLRIFSENIMSGYFNQEEKTKSVIKNGWFYTGDIARFNSDGSISMMGRQRDFIKISSGELVYASEVENCLLQMPGIKEAAVCKYFEMDTEKMVAFVVSDSENPEKENIREFIAENIGRQKVPNQIRFVESLPYSSIGKVLKKKLIEDLVLE